MIWSPTDDAFNQQESALGRAYSALPMDTGAIERIRQEADALFTRWLFGPPGLHIRDYVGTSTTTAPVTTSMSSEESEDGETSLVPAA